MSGNDEPEDRKPWWALWAVLGTSPIFFLCAYLGSEERGFVAWMFMLLLGIALAAHWSSRRHVLFWVAAVTLLTVHVALITVVPWPAWKLSGQAFVPIGFLDFLVNFLSVRFVQTVINRVERSASAA